MVLDKKHWRSELIRYVKLWYRERCREVGEECCVDLQSEFEKAYVVGLNLVDLTIVLESLLNVRFDVDIESILKCNTIGEFVDNLVLSIKERV